MSSIDKRELIGRYIEAYNTFGIDSMLALLHPDIRFKNLSNGKITVQTAGKSEFVFKDGLIWSIVDER